MREEGVPQVGDPLRPGHSLHRGADEVHRARRRRRHDDVDPLAARDRDRLRDRRRVPRHVLVRDEQPPPDGGGAADGQVDARAPVQLVREAPAARPDVACPVHPRLRRER